MEKFGVDVESEEAKVASEKAEPKCPRCGQALRANTNVPTCPSCGTKPFEGGA